MRIAIAFLGLLSIVGGIGIMIGPATGCFVFGVLMCFWALVWE